MKSEWQSDQISLLSATAAVLHEAGQQTSETIRLLERVGKLYGLEPTIVMGWDGATILGLGSGSHLGVFIEAKPTNVAMNRVLAANHVIEHAIEEPATLPECMAGVIQASTISPFSVHLFALAAGAGATALSITFGVGHRSAMALIFWSAGAGVYLRRYIARFGANAIVQAFLAALLAGIVGAYGVRWHVSSELRLIAVCPCMVLVPGPHILNGALDLFGTRMVLAGARLGYAGLILAAICCGLIAGLALRGETLPIAPAGRDIDLWPLILAAAIAAASYSVFFSLPLQFVGWPLAAAVLADTARWGAITFFHWASPSSAGLAALVAGVILVPVSRCRHLPFAGIGFAAIVSLVPGVLTFRIAAGLFELPTASPEQAVPLVQAIVMDGTTALVIIAAMTIGIVIPKHVYDAFTGARSAHRAR